MPCRKIKCNNARQNVGLVGAQERAAHGRRLVHGRADPLAKSHGRVQGDAAPRSRCDLWEIAKEMARLVGVDEDVLQHLTHVSAPEVQGVSNCVVRLFRDVPEQRI